MMLLIFNTLLLGNALAQQETTSENQEITRTAPPEAVALEDAVRAFERVERYPRTGEESEPTGVEASVVAVTVRRDGELIAESVHLTDDDLVGQAMRRARSMAMAWFERHPAFPMVPERWTIELELGGAWTPRSAQDWASLAKHASPGVRGVGVRLGTGAEETTSTLMPTRQLRYGLGPSGVWRRAAADVGAPLGMLADLVAHTGIRFYTFEVERVMKDSAWSPLKFPHRSGEVVGLDTITTPGLMQSASEMARFLESSLWTGERPLGMAGNLDLVNGARTPEIAPIREQLVAAMALARFARLDGADAEDAARARNGAINIIDDALSFVVGEELFADDPIASAIFLVAVAEAGRSGPIPARIAEALGPSRDLVISFATGQEGSHVEAGVASLLALALIRDARELGGPAEHLGVGQRIARAVLSNVGGEGSVIAMPWLAWAMIEGAAGEERVPGDLALLDFRDHAERYQTNDLMLSARDRDLVGGFIWPESPDIKPNWGSLHTVAALGIMLGDPRLTTKEERIERLDRLRRGARFVRELTVMADDLSGYKAGSDALGAVRRSVWGDEGAIDATAMGLLTLCETIEGVRRAFGNESD